MKDFAKFHFKYTSLEVKYLRILVLGNFCLLINCRIIYKNFPNVSVIFLSLFLIFEVSLSLKFQK